MAEVITNPKNIEIWKSMGNPFYSMFFALQWSALLLSDKGIFSWSHKNETYIVVSILLTLFSYYIFDWYDANLTPETDKDTKISDIFLWCLSVLLLAVIIFLYIRLNYTNGFYEKSLPIYLSLIYSILSIPLRDKRLSEVQKEIEKKGNILDLQKLHRYRVFKYGTLFFIVILIVPIIILTHIHFEGIKTDGLKNEETFKYIFKNENIYWLISLLIIFIPALVLKIYRNKKILKVISENQKSE